MIFWDMLVPWRVLLFPSILWFNGKTAPFGDTSNLSFQGSEFFTEPWEEEYLPKDPFFCSFKTDTKKTSQKHPTPPDHFENPPGTMSHHRMSSWESKGIPQCDLFQGSKGPCWGIMKPSSYTNHIQILNEFKKKTTGGGSIVWYHVGLINP